MTVNYMNLLWSFEFRNGFGFDIEAADSRAVWTTDGEGDIKAMQFDGIVICLPFCIFCVGNLLQED